MRKGKEGAKPAKRRPTAAASKKTTPKKGAPTKGAPTKGVPTKGALAKARGSAAKKPAASKKKGLAKAWAMSTAKRGPTRDGGIGAALLKTADKQLNLQRNEILSLYRLNQGVGQGVSHEGEDDVDRANFDANRDLALSLSTAEREALLLIQEALGRLDRGSYGSCSNCSTTIAEERLLSIPWARHCVDCQELEERGLLHQ